MKEIPNPLESFNLIEGSITKQISNSISSKILDIKNIRKTKKFKKILSNIQKKSKKSFRIKSKLNLNTNKNLEIATTTQEQVTPAIHTKKTNPIQVTWARHLDQIKEAQRLRFKIFSEEMGARLPENQDRLDVDMFDKYCEHLIVRDLETLKVIGTYRALPPHQAKQIGCLYSDSEFDLVRLNHLRHKIVEVGRSCVHKDYRSGGVIMSLWGGLAQYMKQNNYEIMLGCASVPMADGGHYAASLNQMLQADHMSPIEYRAFPRLALPLETLNNTLEVEPPPLVKGYLRLGAKICSEPAWDPDFNTADFLTMLRISDINPRYAKHFM